MTPVLATIVALTNLMGTVEIDTRGARVTSYVPVGGSEVFFASASRNVRDDPRPKRVNAHRPAEVGERQDCGK